MLKSQKHVFWEALLVTVLIFGIGIFVGVVLENMRAGKISDMYTLSDINLLDAKVQTQILDLESFDCDIAVKKNIEFGDRIYEDAQILEGYGEASRLTDFIMGEHKRYDLLRELFWINSIKIKDKCGESFHTVVYLYDYNTEDLEQKNKQVVFSKFLEELKSKYKDEIVLIPIAKNLGLTSINFLAEDYGVEGTSIIVDEKIVITEFSELEEVESYLG